MNNLIKKFAKFKKIKTHYQFNQVQNKQNAHKTKIWEKIKYMHIRFKNNKQ
jgi:hypothetical protein